MKKIILIDNDSNTRLNVKEALANEGFNVYLALEKQQAFEMVSGLRPDLVISDVDVPNIDVFEILNFIRTSETLSSIPFILLSNQNQYLKVRYGLELGANDFIFKPFRIEQIINSIGVQLNKNTQLLDHFKNENQKKLTLAITEAEEKERRRIAADLHDGVCPLLACGVIQLDNLVHKLESVSPAIQIEVDLLKSILMEAITETRQIMNNLAPAPLLNNNLVKATNKLCEQVQNLTSTVIYCSVEITNDNPLHPNLNASVYRILQELLNNIVKYAKAKNAYVSISHIEDELLIDVVDDGQGFERSLIPPHATEIGGRGLSNIEQRVRMMGGIVNIKSTLNKGTQVHINIPTTV